MVATLMLISLKNAHVKNRIMRCTKHNMLLAARPSALVGSLQSSELSRDRQLHCSRTMQKEEQTATRNMPCKTRLAPATSREQLHQFGAVQGKDPH